MTGVAAACRSRILSTRSLHPKNITAINHCIQLHDVEVILRLYVLIDIKVGVAVVRPVVPNLWVLKALFL